MREAVCAASFAGRRYMRPSSLTEAAVDVCAKTVFIPPAIEEINVIQATAEENDRAASSDPQHGHREKDAEQEAVARGFSPADSSESGGTSGSCSGGGFLPAPRTPRRPTQTRHRGEKILCRVQAVSCVE